MVSREIDHGLPFPYIFTPEVGLEPTTNRLTADCSTTELLWNRKYLTKLIMN